jgi:hypothetical protein
MDTPRSLDATSAPTLIGQLSRAAARIDRTSLWALLALFVGWFFMDTLVASLGSLRHGLRFFDISAAIADPTRIFFGVDGSLRRIMFGGICIACLLAPLVPHWRSHRLAWIAYLAPLALMIFCGVLLYAKSSGDFFPAPSDAGSLTRSVMRFANDMVNRGTGLVSKHISVGAGGYLAFAGALMLAIQGTRHFHGHGATVTSPATSAPPPG